MSSGEQQFGVFVYGVVDVDADAVSYLAGFPENPDLVGIGTGQQATMANSWEVVSDILNEGACLLFYSRPDGLVSGGALSQQFAHEDLDRSVERSDQSYRIED